MKQARTAKQNGRPRESLVVYGSYAESNGFLRLGIHFDKPIPKKYSNVNGPASISMLIGSAGVRNIDTTKITRMAIRHLTT